MIKNVYLKAIEKYLIELEKRHANEMTKVLALTYGIEMLNIYIAECEKINKPKAK